MKTFSDEKVKAYFLGKLAAEAEIFEEEYSASAELTGQAQLIERELTDDYLRGNLSAEENRSFEANYLVTEARRGKLLVAENLWKIASEKPQSAAAPHSFRQTFFAGQKVFRLAFGGLILLLFFGAIAFYFSNPDVKRSDVAEINVTNPPAKIEDPVIQNHQTADQNTTAAATDSVAENREDEKNLNSAPKNQSEPKIVSIPKTDGQNPPGLAVFTLLPGTLRDAGEQFINVAANTKNLSLQLMVPEDAAEYQIYRAVLKPVEGETIYTSPKLKSLSFMISAEKLENRTYIIFLEGRNAQNEFESVAEYSFRVRR